MTYANYQPLIEVTRGNLVESVHFGAIAVVDSNGHLVASYGNPDTKTFMRSSAKPFQALPLVEMGGMEMFGFQERELALMCASHSGTDEHVAVVEGIHKKIGVTEADLLCGTHTPEHKPTAAALLLRGEQPTPSRHNCSGKHSGMLAQARMLNLPLDNYIDMEHPVQKNILKTFAEMCDLSPQDVEIGIDGCSVPNFAISLRHAALGFARLCDPCHLSAERANACRRITAAMMRNPDMVAGPGRFDTLVMQTADESIVSKAGAEGYQAMGVLVSAGRQGSPSLGIAMKIADGNAERARPLVAFEILRQLGVLKTEQYAALKEFDFGPIYNQRKIVVGETRPYFVLDVVF